MNHSLNILLDKSFILVPKVFTKFQFSLTDFLPFDFVSAVYIYIICGLIMYV